MKTKKVIAMLTMLSLAVSVMGPALAGAAVNTDLARGAGGGTAPEIKAKWEMKGPCFYMSSYNDCSAVTGGEGKDDHVDSLMLATLPHRYSQIDYSRISKVNVADFIDVDGDIFRGLDEGGFSFGSGTKPKEGSGTLAGYRSSGYRAGGKGNKKGWEL